MTRTMTLYEALQEKKLIEKRLKNMDDINYFFISTENDDTLNGMAKEKAMNMAISAYQSRMQLIKNLREYQQKIAEANSITKVVIRDIEYTLAGAISKYNTLSYEKDFLITLKSQLDSCLANIATTNSRINNPDVVSGYVAKILGDSKKTDDLVKTTVESYIKTHTVHLVDPNDLQSKLDDLIECCLGFEKEFHFKINEANFKTNITIELT